MNLTKQPPHQKDMTRGALSRRPTMAERAHWKRVLQIPCVAGPLGCNGRLTLHHCDTGMGRRKDHMKVLPLCYEHHLGTEGIDGKHISKLVWQSKYGTESALLALVQQIIKGEKL